MIVELSVENLAIIESSHLELGSGFTVLTGETGAGKSLLIDAIELALGERADVELVRTGAPRASVNVVFDLSHQAETLQKCRDLGIELGEHTLHIQREVLAEGRSQCRIEGKLTPVGTLRQLGALLVDLHGQHDHQSLMDQPQHAAFLDNWIGPPAHEAREAVSAAYTQAEDVRRRLSAVREGVRDREQRLDLLKFQIQEIESVEPKVGEMEELEAQLSRLKNVERLFNAAFAALEQVSDQESSALDLLGGALKGIEAVVRFDASLDEIAGPWREALVTIQEGAHALRSYAESLDSDPRSLDELALRIDALKRLRRKYGDDEAAVLAHLQRAQEQLLQLTDSETSESELVDALRCAQTRLEELAKRLTEIRSQAAPEFGALVQAQLRDLAMEKAEFATVLQPETISSAGADRIEFYFSANPGESLKPLAKIASGGEISRVMLAIKTALAGSAGVPTLIFDEIDAGLGGRVAATVARKLAELAQHYQVLVISHLPQIASRAGTHFRIEKLTENGRVQTRVRPLNEHERIEEIARMLAGEHVTPTALASAREMLEV